MSRRRIKDDSDVLLTAKECAARIGLTVRGLRLYESRGLISPRRTEKSWRLYGAAEISRLNEILALKRMGLSLAQIANLLEGRAVDLDRTLAIQQSSILQLRNRADQGLALVTAARLKISAGGSLSIADLIALAKETNMAEATFDAIVQRRYEQARPRTAIRLDPTVLDRYVGHFRFEDVLQVGTIHREGDRLFVKAVGQPTFEIFPESDHTFFFKTVAAQITFAVGPNGIADALVDQKTDTGAMKISSPALTSFATDWTAIISKMRAANPDAVIMSTAGGAPNVTLQKQYNGASNEEATEEGCRSSAGARTPGGHALGVVLPAAWEARLLGRGACPCE